MRKLVSILMALLLMIPVSSANAQTSCYGCNVVDEGVYGSALVGQVIFLRGQMGVKRAVVYDIDPANELVFAVEADGTRWHSSARNAYTPMRSAERDFGWVATAAVAVGLLYCILGGCSGSESSADSAPQAYDYDRVRRQCLDQCRYVGAVDANEDAAIRDNCVRRCR